MPPISIPILIDHHRLSLRTTQVTGRTLKELAGLSPDTALFLTGAGEDRLIADEGEVTVLPGDQLFSLPAAAYGTDHDKAHGTDGPRDVVVHINRKQHVLHNPVQTGRALKQVASIPLEDVLFLDRKPDDMVVANDSVVTLKNGDHLHSQVPATYGSPHKIPIFINKDKFDLEHPVQTGLSLKKLAGIDPATVLFLDAHPEDIVIANDGVITLRPGSHLHSQLPGDYGLIKLATDDRPREQYEEHPQPDGWLFLILRQVRLPPAFMPERVDVLIKLPPLFPDAAPDMFWTSPAVVLRSGGSPQNTSIEQVLGAPWLRFSWHLAPGAWKPGVSTLQDFIRCIRGRFERGN